MATSRPSCYTSLAHLGSPVGFLSWLNGLSPRQGLLDWPRGLGVALLLMTTLPQPEELLSSQHRIRERALVGGGGQG